ncbi:MAG TPA: cyclic nucleotide-binding domain-containing protein [Candidatus Limnocylindria bacterium]|nr:cyclic nucleotide-binding domain-containing protein [Candidatus Limnocylindria bacterium]
MARDEKLELLKRVPLFAGLGGRELERLGMLADEVDLKAGRVLMRQGERGDQMFVIIDGAVDVERDGTVIARRGAGDILGEIALVDGGPRAATVTLASDARLLVVGRREFHSLMDEFPEVRLRILETLAQRIRRAEPEEIH